MRSGAQSRTWQVKASTLCNFRCRYCYEWDRLRDGQRMPLAIWRGLFGAIRAGRAGGDRDRIVWHGGEPLLLPPGYVLDVLALQRDLLGSELASGAVVNAVQTNLSRFNETLELMVAAGFLFSVSIDGEPGVRRTVGGDDGDAVALGNLVRLLEAGAPAGVLVVLGRHNLESLIPLHDRLVDLGVAWLNVVPAFAPGNGAPADGLIPTPDEAAAALAALHAHRLERSCPIPVEPLDRSERIARRGVSGGGLRRRSRRRIIVEPDGRLRPVIGGPCSGRIGPRAPRVPWRTEKWAGAERAFREREARICGACALRDICDDQPLARRPWADAPVPCPVETRLVAVLEGQVRPITASVQ